MRCKAVLAWDSLLDINVFSAFVKIISRVIIAKPTWLPPAGGAYGARALRSRRPLDELWDGGSGIIDTGRGTPYDLR